MPKCTQNQAMAQSILLEMDETKALTSSALSDQADDDYVYTNPSLLSCKCNFRPFRLEAGVLCFYLEGQHKKQEASSHGCTTTSDQMRVVRVVWKATFKHCINQSSSA